MSSVSKFVVSLTASIVLFAVPSFGQDAQEALLAFDDVGSVVGPGPIDARSLVTFGGFPRSAPATLPARSSKPSLSLISLDMTFATLQALDLHSTWSATTSGNGRELNPVMAGLLDKPAALVAFKGATAAGILYLSHVVAKRNRTAAILTMLGMNTAYGFVAWHNYSIARGR